MKVKNTYTIIKTQAVTFTEYKDAQEVFSILAVESDGETSASAFAYDVARHRARAEEILARIERISPSPAELADVIEEIL